MISSANFVTGVKHSFWGSMIIRLALRSLLHTLTKFQGQTVFLGIITFEIEKSLPANKLLITELYSSYTSAHLTLTKGFHRMTFTTCTANW